MQEILTIGRYFKRKFHTKVYKVPVSMMGFTCPNIDGTVARGGCSFCENESFSPNIGKVKLKKVYLNPKSKDNPFLENQLEQLETQFKWTKSKLINKFGAKKFLVYFQSFTNTYAPFETLEKLYLKALSLDDVIGLSIGTRTDSITEKILDFLKELSQEKEIWVEYGIQSIYDTTLKKINRGHDSKNIYEWIEKTKKRDLKICAHLIFGLPNETQEMMLESLKASIDMGVDSLKIHPLYVVKNTALTAEYRKGKFKPISEELYIDTLIKAFKIIPKNIIIQRVTAGIDDNSLLAPSWCRDKHQQMQNIRKALLKKGFIY